MSMSVGSASGEDEVMVEMNTTPLIDVMLVLLVLLIVTLPIQTHAVKLGMPSGLLAVKPTIVELGVDWFPSLEASSADLVETYVASLPATHAHETWRDLGITSPTGILDNTIQNGIAPKTRVDLLLAAPADEGERHKAQSQHRPG